MGSLSLVPCVGKHVKIIGSITYGTTYQLHEIRQLHEGIEQDLDQLYVIYHSGMLYTLWYLTPSLPRLHVLRIRSCVAIGSTVPTYVF